MHVLFAEADINTFTVAMAVIAAVGAFGTAWLNVIAGRDKLRFDAKTAAMERDMAECHQEKDEQRLAMDGLRNENESLRRQVGELQTDLADLRKDYPRRRRPGKGDTDEAKPLPPGA